MSLLKDVLFFGAAFIGLLVLLSFYTRRRDRLNKFKEVPEKPYPFVPTRHDTVIREVEGRDYE